MNVIDLDSFFQQGKYQQFFDLESAKLKTNATTQKLFVSITTRGCLPSRASKTSSKIGRPIPRGDRQISPSRVAGGAPPPRPQAACPKQSENEASSGCMPP